MTYGWRDSNSGPPPEGLPGGGYVDALTCGFLAPVVTGGDRCNPLSALPSCTHRVPAGSVLSDRGRLRRSGPPQPGTNRPAGHGKVDAGVEKNSTLRDDHL
jgi:hypothetical protein